MWVKESALIAYYDSRDKDRVRVGIAAQRYSLTENKDDTFDMFALSLPSLLGPNTRIKQPVYRCPTKPIMGGI